MLTNLKTEQKNKITIILVFIGTVIVNLLINLVPTYIIYYLLTNYTQYTLPFGFIYLMLMLPRVNVSLDFKMLKKNISISINI